MDIDTPRLNKLTIIGVLEIPDTMNSSSIKQAQYNTVVIDAVYISIQVSVISHLFDFHDYPDYDINSLLMQLKRELEKWDKVVTSIYLQNVFQEDVLMFFHVTIQQLVSAVKVNYRQVKKKIWIGSENLNCFHSDIYDLKG